MLKLIIKRGKNKKKNKRNSYVLNCQKLSTYYYAKTEINSTKFYANDNIIYYGYNFEYFTQ